MIRLLWICSTLPPYNSFLFRSLSAHPGIVLRVVVNKMEDARHPWKTDLTRDFNVRPIRRMVGIDWGLLRDAMWASYPGRQPDGSQKSGLCVVDRYPRGGRTPSYAEGCA